MFKIMKLWAVVAGLVLGLASSATAQWTHWHNSENPPVTTGNLWSDDANWTNGTPAAGWGFRIEQYDGDAAGTGTVIMDVDYSAGGLNVAQFFGTETVHIQEYFKVNDSIHLNNGGNAPDGAHILVQPSGTIWGNVRCGSENGRRPPVLDFAGGDWVSGNVTTSEGFRQGGIIRVSSNSNTITPGKINVSLAPHTNPADRPGFQFVLVADGVTPVHFTDADPLQFTGAAAGTNPFMLSVDMAAYTGPAVDIPLVTFEAGVAETDVLFDQTNITIDGVPVDWTADVVQSDTGVVLTLSSPDVTYTWEGGAGLWPDANWHDGSTGSQAPSSGGDMVIDAENDGAEPPVISGPSAVTVDADFVDGGDGPAASVTLGAIGDATNDAQLKIDVGVTLEVTGATDVAEFGKIVSSIQGNDTDGTAESGVVETEDLTITNADSIQVDWTDGSDATSMFGGVYTISEYTGTALADFGESANAAGNIGGAYIKNTDYAVDVNGDGSLYAVEIELHAQGVGDTDLDGVVGPADLANFGLGWSPNGTDKTWAEGDSDFNGNVNPADLAAFGLAWAPNGITFPSATGVATVPEPGTALMLLLGMAGLLIYRKRRS